MTSRQARRRFAALLLLSALGRAPTFAANYRLGYGGDFTLIDQDGRRFSLRDVRGKVVLLHFGFVGCGETCPTTMAKVGAALDRLGARAAQVQPLLISIDTQRDTPQVLRAYVRNFHPSYIGLTGTQREVEAVARRYRAPVFVHPPDRDGNYVADHGSALYLIDTDGVLADLLFYATPVEAIARRIENLLNRRD
jgi:cytochrome oxidase Cu insertion factor (SCO1/SenC/PrrC family)